MVRHACKFEMTFSIICIISANIPRFLSTFCFSSRLPRTRALSQQCLKPWFSRLGSSCSVVLCPTCHRACMRCLKTSAPWTTQEHFTFCCNICTWGITASDPRCKFVSEVFIQPYVPKGTPVVEGKHWHDRLRVEFATWCVRYRVVYVTKICPSDNYIEVIAWTTL
jgi:hypothetical protein